MKATEFKVTGLYAVSNCGGYEIEISNSGDMARVRDAFGSDDPQVSGWMEIEYVEDNNDEGNTEMVPVIDPNGYNIPLNLVTRV